MKKPDYRRTTLQKAMATRIDDGISDEGIASFEVYNDEYPWNHNFWSWLKKNDHRRGPVALRMKAGEMIKILDLYGGYRIGYKSKFMAAYKLRDAIRHAEIKGDPVPSFAYKALRGMKNELR